MHNQARPRPRPTGMHTFAAYLASSPAPVNSRGATPGQATVLVGFLLSFGTVVALFVIAAVRRTAADLKDQRGRAGHSSGGDMDGSGGGGSGDGGGSAVGGGFGGGDGGGGGGGC